MYALWCYSQFPSPCRFVWLLIYPKKIYISLLCYNIKTRCEHINLLPPHTHRKSFKLFSSMSQHFWMKRLRLCMQTRNFVNLFRMLLFGWWWWSWYRFEFIMLTLQWRQISYPLLVLFKEKAMHTERSHFHSDTFRNYYVRTCPKSIRWEIDTTKKCNKRREWRRELPPKRNVNIHRR